MDASDQVTVNSQLSPALGALFAVGNQSQAIIEVLNRDIVVYEDPCVLVLCLDDDIAVKITNENLLNEYAALSYLQKHCPRLSVPRPHGLVRFGHFYLLFTSFIPGLDLEKAWPQLQETEKLDISQQLESIFVELRSIPFPNNQPIGVGGENCKDIRRNVRISSKPMYNVDQFQDFIFTGSKTASSLYVDFLRSLFPAPEAKCVFTHGDVRPANIIVQKDESETWKVVAIIDWQSSGFYPEYWECIKVTNNFKGNV